MATQRFYLIIVLVMIFSACDDDYDPFDPGDQFTGINRISVEMTDELDYAVARFMDNYSYICIGIILDGEIVLTKSYNDDQLENKLVYASVTKPVTSTICMMMVEEGLIESIGDPVNIYSEKYSNVLPPECENYPLTFQHLLSHKSGIPHHDRIWEGRNLALEFCPGEGFLYSTRGYGVLGEILSEISGKSYSKLLKNYIADNVGATSFSVPGFLFEAPGGLVKSNIYDMTLFAEGIMNESYLTDSTLLNEVWVPWSRDQDFEVGLGWYLNHVGTDSLTVFHAGSNGQPRAFIALRPIVDNGIVLLGKVRSADESQHFYELARELMLLISN